MTPDVEQVTNQTCRIFHGGMIFTAHAHPTGGWIIEHNQNITTLPPGSCPCCFAKLVQKYRRQLNPRRN